MKPWKLLKQVRIHDGWRPVIATTFEHPRRGSTTVEVVSDNDRDASVIAIDTEGMVIIARQFRCGPRRIMDELPGGMVDPGEAVQDAAVRELREEVGYTAEKMELLGHVYRDAWRDVTSYYFFATGCRPHPSGQQLDEFEDIEIHRISITQLIKNAKTGKMTDAGGVLMAYDKLMKLQTEFEQKKD